MTPFAQLLASLRNVRGNLVAIANLPANTQPTSAASHLPSTPPTTSGAHAPTSDERLSAGGVRSRRSGAFGSAPAAVSTSISGGGCGSYLWQNQTASGAASLPEPVQQCAQETLEELDWCLDQLETIQIHRSVTEMASSKFRKLLNKELSQFAESSKSGTQISKFLINTYMEDREAEEEGNRDAATTAEQHAQAEVNKISFFVRTDLYSNTFRGILFSRGIL